MGIFVAIETKSELTLLLRKNDYETLGAHPHSHIKQNWLVPTFGSTDYFWTGFTDRSESNSI